MCRKIFNNIAFIIAGLTLQLSFTTNCSAATSTTSVKALPPYSMELNDAVIVWHRMKDLKIDPDEFAKLYSKELEYSNEFQQKQRIKAVNEKYKNLGKTLLSVSTFTYAINLKLKDYNFEKGFFPVDVKTGERFIRMGDVNLFHDETKTFDKFLIHYDRIKLDYVVSVKIPESFDKLEIPEDKAAKLLEQLDSDRTIKCVFVGTINNAAESSEVVPKDEFDVIDEANAVTSKKVYYRELGIKLITIELVAPGGAVKDQPEQVIKTWPEASTPGSGFEAAS